MGLDTYCECMQDSIGNRNCGHIRGDIPHTDYQSIRANIDRRPLHFARGKRHSDHMGWVDKDSIFRRVYRLKRDIQYYV